MRRVLGALFSAIVVGLMLAMPVSAETETIVVSDRIGDLGVMWDFTTCEPRSLWGHGTPVVSAGYFDISSFSLSQKGKTYTFGMELAADLPREGDALPAGIYLACWVAWIDPEPYNAKYNPVDSYYTVLLTYDGLKYAAELQDYVTGEVIASLPVCIDGSKFQMQFSASSIGNLESFWWYPASAMFWGAVWDCVDRADSGAVPGQVWWDIPWGSPVWTPP